MKLRIRSNSKTKKKVKKKTSKKKSTKEDKKEEFKKQTEQTSFTIKTTEDLLDKNSEIKTIRKITNAAKIQLKKEMECGIYMYFKDDIIDCNKKLMSNLTKKWEMFYLD